MEKREASYTVAKRELGNIELDNDERVEIESVFSEDDHKLAKFVYAMRKAGGTKSAIAIKLNVPRTTLDRIFRLFPYSALLKEKMSQALAESETMDVTDHQKFKEGYGNEVKTKMVKVMNGITDEKIADAELSELVASSKNLHAIHRLETGQSTDNISKTTKVIGLKEKDLEQQAERDAVLFNKNAEQIEDLKKLVEKSNGQRAITDTTEQVDSSAGGIEGKEVSS